MQLPARAEDGKLYSVIQIHMKFIPAFDDPGKHFGMDPTNSSWQTWTLHVAQGARLVLVKADELSGSIQSLFLVGNNCFSNILECSPLTSQNQSCRLLQNLRLSEN